MKSGGHSNTCDEYSLPDLFLHQTQFNNSGFLLDDDLGQVNSYRDCPILVIPAFHSCF